MPTLGEVIEQFQARRATQGTRDRRQLLEQGLLGFRFR
jgi:hypothetical protein